MYVIIHNVTYNDFFLNERVNIQNSRYWCDEKETPWGDHIIHSIFLDENLNGYVQMLQNIITSQIINVVARSSHEFHISTRCCLSTLFYFKRKL